MNFRAIRERCIINSFLESRNKIEFEKNTVKTTKKKRNNFTCVAFFVLYCPVHFKSAHSDFVGGKTSKERFFFEK